MFRIFVSVVLLVTAFFIVAGLRPLGLEVVFQGATDLVGATGEGALQLRGGLVFAFTLIVFAGLRKLAVMLGIVV